MSGMENMALGTMLVLVLAIPAVRNAYFATGKQQSEPVVGRIGFFDFARGIAILMVLVGHILFFHIVNNPATHETFHFLANNYIRFAIPVFLIASGALLEPPKRSDIAHFYARKFFRLIIPFTVISLIAALYHEIIEDGFSWVEVARLVVTGNAMVPFYFVIVLIQLYLIYPLIAKYAASRRFFIAAFVFSLACGFFASTWYVAGISFAGRFLFFFVYGMYHRGDFLGRADGRRIGALPWTIIVLAFLAIAPIFPAFYDNARLFYGIAVFELLFLAYKRIELSAPGSKTAALVRITTLFGRNSLWIFLTHFPISYISYALVTTYVPVGYYAGFILAFLISVPASFVVARFAKVLYESAVSPKLIFRRDSAVR